VLSNTRGYARAARTKTSLQTVLLTGASALAIATFASQAMAQSAGSTATDKVASKDATETVIVTGIRGSLKSSQGIKQNSDQIVDSVTAVDIGALPDRNVADALQRVPGVTLQRTDTNRDPVRYGGSGNNIFIRGLPWVESLTNGRDTFSAINGRSLSWADVSASLLGGVDVYKNPDAELIEGGIGGVVNLKTRKPFDQDGQIIAINADYTDGSLIKKGTPSINGLYSNRWTTGIGEIGFLISVDQQNQTNRTNGLSTSHYDCLDGTGAIGGTSIFGSSSCDAIPAANRRYIPNFLGWRQIDWVQKRFAVDSSAQWRPNNAWEFTAELFYSKATPHDTEHTLPFNIPQDAQNHPDYTYNAQGVWTGGALPNGCCWFPQTGGVDTRVGWHKDLTVDYSLNAKFNPDNHWSFTADVQHIDSSATNYSMTGYTDFGNPNDPVTTFVPPETLNMKLMGDDPTVSVSDPGAMADPHNFYYAAAMDHMEWDSAHSWAYRADGSYDFNGENSWLKTVDFGYRGSDKQSIARSTNYNWSLLSHENWQWGGNPVFLDQDVGGIGLPNQVSQFSYGKFLGGSVPGGWFINPGLLAKSTTYAYSYLQATETNGWGWTPYAVQAGCAAPGQILSRNAELHCKKMYSHSAAGADAIGGVNRQDEDTNAGYMQVNYAHDDFLGTGIPVDGNFGVRYVVTKDDIAAGKMLLPTITSGCPGGAASCADYNNAVQFSGGLNAGGFFPIPAISHSYTDWLPSFNARFHLTDDIQTRWSYSESIVRPDFANMVNQASLAFNFCSTTPSCAGQFQDPPNGLTGFAGNPHLKPMSSNNYDATLEWYFAPTGSVTVDFFYKDIKDYFLTESFPLTFTNNGVTDSFAVKTYVNGSQGTVEGFELAYQQFYDMLPGPFSGLGVQANYTYIHNVGGANISQNPFDTNQTANATSRLPLEGMSNNSYNVALLYAKYGVDFRLAYNWRSAYLLTSSAANVNQPLWSESYGQLDGSIFYTLWDNYKIGIQATNILKPKTILDVGYADFHPRYDWIETDRKVSLVLRATF
jgi:TonB-dependent receptor